ncbi:MAG TPA: LysR family transcriptional regulator [Gammaproteobacteria bacterium]|nr:LysR family transcriptional regulator [Gammaproteobacteria bacterium]
MNWHAVNFDWNCARAFLVTLEKGSLSAAAKALNLTQPTLSGQVAALESELGVTPFERLAKGLGPTKSGLELLEHLRSMGEAANLLSMTASGKACPSQIMIRRKFKQLYAIYIYGVTT